MSSFADIMAQLEERRLAAEQEAESLAVELADAFRVAGVKQVHITFSGYGDSGQIDDIEIEMFDGRTKPDDLHDRVSDWAYRYLEGTGIDWYNNDGGQGEITFDMRESRPHFTSRVEYNETVSNVGHEEDTYL